MLQLVRNVKRIKYATEAKVQLQLHHFGDHQPAVNLTMNALDHSRVWLVMKLILLEFVQKAIMEFYVVNAMLDIQKLVHLNAKNARKEKGILFNSHLFFYYILDKPLFL